MVSMERGVFRLGTLSEKTCVEDHFQCTKFHACIKKCTIYLKAKRANVNRKVRKLGNITWGISYDIPQFAASRDVFRPIARAKNI